MVNAAGAKSCAADKRMIKPILASQFKVEPQKRINEMIKGFRKISGYMVVSPIFISSKLLSLFVGPDKAVETIGPAVTQLAKLSLKFWVPTINSSKDFDLFSAKMKRNFRFWKPFYDVKICEENDDIFKLHVSNCPFCVALNRLGLSKLSEYVCEGDWAVARENFDKWRFERNNQIGTGNTFCDHTYKRIKKGKSI